MKIPVLFLLACAADHADSFLFASSTLLYSSITTKYHDAIGGGRTNDSASSTSPITMDTDARKSLPGHLQLKEIPGKGYGVITHVRIPFGTVVGDYKGEVMTEEEKDRRYLESFSHLRQPVDMVWKQSRLDRGQSITGSYLYGVAVPDGSRIFVDAEDEFCSLWTRFLNHSSSDANVNPKSLHCGMDGKPRVWFVSMRDIEIGEEICFDYGDDYWLDDDDVV